MFLFNILGRKQVWACWGSCLVLLVFWHYSAGAQNTDEYESVEALWHHGLSVTRLVGYKQNERLVISDVWTGLVGRNAEVTHSLRVRVNSWGKKFITRYRDPKKEHDEIFSVILYKTTNPREISAHFEHTVYERGQVKLRFCGVTRLPRF